MVGRRSGCDGRKRPVAALWLIGPLASSEVEMPLGPGSTSMGVSTSLDTNGEREWLKAADCGLLPIVTLERDKWLVRLDPGSRLRPKPGAASKKRDPGSSPGWRERRNDRKL